jgi:hypothetical protein
LEHFSCEIPFSHGLGFGTSKQANEQKALIIE